MSDKTRIQFASELMARIKFQLDKIEHLEAQRKKRINQRIPKVAVFIDEELLKIRRKCALMFSRYHVLRAREYVAAEIDKRGPLMCGWCNADCAEQGGYWINNSGDVYCNRYHEQMGMSQN